MKVLQVINSLDTGGAEKLLLESIPLYNKRGIKTDILLLNGKETPFFKALNKQECCTIYSLSNCSVYNPILIFKIIPYLKKYDLLHVHLFPSLYWVAFTKMINIKRIKLIYTEHNTTNRRRNAIIFKLIDKFIYSRYSKIITISKEVDINIKGHLSFKPSKFKLIKNGVAIKFFNQAKPYSKLEYFEKKDKILIQVSSFTSQKDQETLISSLAQLPENIKLLLVGEGKLKSNCIRLVHELDLSDRVKFLGIRTDIPELLKTADIVVLSSHHEGLSLSSIEGMASGKPFIASDVPGLTEVVKGAGLLFPDGDVKALAVHIENLLNNSNYYNRISMKCLERAKEFDIAKMVNKYEGVYDELYKL